MAKTTDPRHDSGYLQADRNVTPHRHIIVRSEFLRYRNGKSTTTSVAEA